MRRILVAAVVAFGLAGGAQAMGTRSVTRGNAHKQAQQQPAQAAPIGFVAVPKADPLFKRGLGAPETPYMAASTGRWDLPGRLPPPVVGNFVGVGVFKDD